MADAPTLAKAQEEDALDLLSGMVRTRSVMGTPGEADLARFLAEKMRGLGLEVDLQEVEPGRFNAIGRWRGTGGGA